MKVSHVVGPALLGACLYGAVTNSYPTDAEKDAVGDAAVTNAVEQAAVAARLFVRGAPPCPDEVEAGARLRRRLHFARSVLRPKRLPGREVAHDDSALFAAASPVDSRTICKTLRSKGDATFLSRVIRRPPLSHATGMSRLLCMSRLLMRGARSRPVRICRASTARGRFVSLSPIPKRICRSDCARFLQTRAGKL